MTDSKEQFQTCSAHGLHFDPRVTSGCVLCRSSQPATQDGSRLRWQELAVVLALVSLTSVIAFGLWQRGQRVSQPASDEKAGPSALPGASAPPLASQPVGALKFLASPELLPLQADGRRCDGGDEVACSRFIDKCKSSGAYPAKPFHVGRTFHPLEGTCGALDRILAKRCRRDEVEACAELGQRSISWRSRACKLGHAESCARIVEHPEFVAEQQGAIALAHCQTGDSATCMRLAGEREAQIPPDVEGADELRRQACRQGHAPACDELDERAARAPRQATRACEAGEYEACRWMRRHAARSPQGGPAQAEEFRLRGVAIVERRCAAGDRQACRDLGLELMSAGGAAAQRGRAQLDSACRAGDELSCVELGRTFSVAFGSPAHHDRALSQQYYALALPLSEASCNQGDADACERAAFAYGAGFGVAPDSAKADTLRARAIALARARRP